MKTRQEIEKELKEAERKLAFWRKGTPPKFLPDLEAEVAKLQEELRKAPR